jgi:precorrin-8X/cobalt-precorrin-8 methylmutase
MMFDACIFVDWSARAGRGPAKPRKDSVWVGSASRSAKATAQYCRTRAEATEAVRALLLIAYGRGERVLVGFDFPYGYPSGFAAVAGFGAPPWSATWRSIAELLEDGEDNRSNRFAVAEAVNRRLGDGTGPFWGRPVPRKGVVERVRRSLEPTSPGFPFDARGGGRLARLRLCDARLRGVQECWKLFGVGSVGSQALTGIPRVRSLRFDPVLAPVSAVWPFETGFTRTFASQIIHAEIWPGVVEERVSRRSEAIRDEAQVLALCDWVRGLDDRGELGALFERPPGLEEEQVRTILEEEGWVLGCGCRPPASRRRATMPSR